MVSKKNDKAEKLVEIKREYFNNINEKAKYIAHNISHGKKGNKATPVLLKYISELYKSANVEKEFNNTLFDSAYHQPVTSDFELLIARALYYISNRKKLGWKIYLRRQHKDNGVVVTPDIKIEKEGKVVAIIEVKAKAGWMQSFFSNIRRDKDFEQNKNPDELIAKVKKQIDKYVQIEGANKNKVFVLLPTFIHVSRKNNDETVEDFRKAFAYNSGLSKDNLILLSKNKSLNLADIKNDDKIDATDDFERFIEKIEKF